MLHTDIKEGIKEAMKARDAVRLDTLRGISTAFTNELVAKGKTPQDMLTDEEALSVMTRLAKQRKDSIAQYRAGGRDDLVKEEEAQLSVITAYLPQMMSRAEIEPLVRAKMAELGITDKTKSGQLVGMLMKDLKGKAEGDDVKAVVEGALQ